MATRPRGACGLQRAGRRRRKGTGSSSSNETAHLHGGVLGPHGLSGGDISSGAISTWRQEER